MIINDKISGALFDFLGYLTTREETIKVGSKENVVPLIELFSEWAKLRELDTNYSDVLNWNK